MYRTLVGPLVTCTSKDSATHDVQGWQKGLTDLFTIAIFIRNV